MFKSRWKDAKKMIRARLGVLAVFTILLSGCFADDNDAPKYGKDSKLPLNCRAYIQFAIDEYRAGKYTADSTFVAIERNCGVNGHSWKNIREK
jgi:hypothetical protein